MQFVIINLRQFRQRQRRRQRHWKGNFLAKLGKNYCIFQYIFQLDSSHKSSLQKIRWEKAIRSAIVVVVVIATHTENLAAD